MKRRSHRNCRCSHCLKRVREYFKAYEPFQRHSNLVLERMRATKSPARRAMLDRACVKFMKGAPKLGDYLEL